MYTFKKEERLCNKSLIDGLYHKGSSFLCYPYKVSFLISETALPAPVQVVFPVARKRFKKAVDRNLIRRRTREAYRLHKQDQLYSFLGERNIQLILSLSYIGKEILPYKQIEKKLVKTLAQLREQAGK